MAAHPRAVQLLWLATLGLVLCITFAVVAYRAEREAESSLAGALLEPTPPKGDEDPLLAALFRGAEAEARARRRARRFWRLAACAGVPGVGLVAAAVAMELRRRRREGIPSSPFRSRGRS